MNRHFQAARLQDAPYGCDCQTLAYRANDTACAKDVIRFHDLSPAPFFFWLLQQLAQIIRRALDFQENQADIGVFADQGAKHGILSQCGKQRETGVASDDDLMQLASLELIGDPITQCQHRGRHSRHAIFINRVGVFALRMREEDALNA